MKKGYVHVCVVLDASGSMRVIENDVKGTFNGFIDEQRKADGKTVLDVYQFADESKRVVEAADLAEFGNDLMNGYRCGGCTALNDAVCDAIDELGATFAKLPEEERPESVFFAILTDGEENASRRFSTEDVKKRVERQSKVYNWNFVFLAADIDAFATGKSLGIAVEDCAEFSRSAQGMVFASRFMEERVSEIREEKRNRNKKS